MEYEIDTRGRQINPAIGRANIPSAPPASLAGNLTPLYSKVLSHGSTQLQYNSYISADGCPGTPAVESSVLVYIPVYQVI